MSVEKGEAGPAGEAAWRYHNGTKHPGGRLLNPRHRYGPAQRPLLYKVYTELDPIPLPLSPEHQGEPTLAALGEGVESEQPPVPDFATLARVLHYSAGITKRLRFGPPVGEMPFRAAACTGALYHIELYVACRDLRGLPAGLYHYDPRASALGRLRSGDHRAALVEAAAGEPSLRRAPAVLIYTDVYWRNACKYQARAYRHAFWDSGTILANTLAMAGAKGLPARAVTGFVDEGIARLLDLDRERELPLLMVPLGEDPAGEPEPAPEIEPLGLEVRSISPRERVEPAIVEMHAASALGDQEAVRAWRGRAGAIGPPAPSGETLALKPLAEEALPDEPLEAVIQRRGSSRRFRRDPLGFEKLSTVLEHAIQPMEADVLGGERGFLNQPYLIANAVEGLPSGSYRYHPGRERLERLRPGRFRDQAGELALGQALGADAAVCMFFLTDLGEVLGRFGDRGYRTAQLEAAVLAGRVYLASYALGFGATGLTFFDDAVTAFFSPQAEGKSVMFLIALGVPAKRGP